MLRRFLATLATATIWATAGVLLFVLGLCVLAAVWLLQF